MVIASPASPTVTITDLVSTDSPRGRGMRAMARALIEAEREAERGVDEEVDPQHLRGPNGSPAALNRAALSSSAARAAVSPTAGSTSSVVVTSSGEREYQLPASPARLP
jgi:hypothetical protein